MPVGPFQILPGVVTEATAKDAKPYWKDCNRIKFNGNTVENMAGWIKDSNTPLSGIARCMNNWTTLTDDRLIGIGTHKKLYVWRGGLIYNITPLQDSTDAPFSSAVLNDPFAVVNASATVTVTHVAHDLSVGDTVVYSAATAGGGITINGEYEVITVPSVNTYTITHSSAATSTDATTGGVAVEYDYEITIGAEITRSLLGWGALTWNNSTWGTPRASSGISQFARQWSLDQWGEDLIACVRGGAIYTWDASAGFTTRASLIVGAPANAKFIIVSPEDRRLIAFGAHNGSTSDPLYIRWSDSELYGTFTPTITNTAGDKRIDRGTEIVGGVRTRGQIIFFTDVGAHAMFPSNDEFVYGFSQLGERCGLIAPRAVTEVGGVVRWMGFGKFFIYDGTVREIPCPIRNHIFENINMRQSVSFFACTNAANNEIMYFYCSASSDEIDSYAKHNLTLDVWDYGSLARTAWIDIGEGGGLSTPYAMGSDRYLYQHEVGVDDNTEPLNSFIESHDINLAGGNDIVHIKRIYPDFVELTGSVDMIVKTRDYPQSEYREKGPRTLTADTEFVALRCRGRQMALRLESSNKGDKWRAGTFNAQAITNGKR